MTAAARDGARVRQRPHGLAFGLPAVIVTIAFVAIPFISTLVDSLSDGSGGFTLQRYISFFTDPHDLAVLRTTFVTSAAVAIATLLLSYPLALYVALTRDRGRRYALLVILSPLLISVVVRAYALVLLLGPGNPIDRLTGNAYGTILNTQGAVIIGLIYVFITFMLLPIVSSLNAIDPAVIAAARSLGASTPAVFLRVIFPLTLTGVVAGCLMVFMLSATSFILPILLGGTAYKMMASLVYEQVFSLFDWPAAYTLGVILVALSALVWLAGRLLTGRTSEVPLQ